MAKKHSDGGCSSTTRRTYELPVALVRRLGAFVAWNGYDANEVVAEALKHHLKGFSVSTSARPESAPPALPSEEPDRPQIHRVG